MMVVMMVYRIVAARIPSTAPEPASKLFEDIPTVLAAGCNYQLFYVRMSTLHSSYTKQILPV